MLQVKLVAPPVEDETWALVAVGDTGMVFCEVDATSSAVDGATDVLKRE